MHYYNENDADACDALRLEIARGRLPAGHVDQRSIADVRPSDLVGFSQCDFFAGIGGAGLARRLAGWPDELELWTGGFPCQDISVAGKGAGLEGSRSGLWWEWFRLIDACRPARLLIENVSALRTRGADAVLAALEGIGYACRALVVGADHVGAPHRRHRVWIVADRNSVGECEPEHKELSKSREWPRLHVGGSGTRSELADRTRRGLGTDGSAQRDARHADERGKAGLVHPSKPGLEGHGADAGQPQGRESGSAGASVEHADSGNGGRGMSLAEREAQGRIATR